MIDRPISTREIVSFKRPITLLKKRYGDYLEQVLVKGITPFQHPIVLIEEFSEIDEMCEDTYKLVFDIIKETDKRKNKVRRKFGYNGKGFMIPREKPWLHFSDSLTLAFYKHSPLHILDVVALLQFSDTETVPSGYHEHFVRRFPKNKVRKYGEKQIELSI